LDLNFTIGNHVYGLSKLANFANPIVNESFKFHIFTIIYSPNAFTNLKKIEKNDHALYIQLIIDNLKARY